MGEGKSATCSESTEIITLLVLFGTPKYAQTQECKRFPERREPGIETTLGEATRCPRDVG